MRRFAIIFLQFLLFGAAVSAGSIAVSISDTVNPSIIGATPSGTCGPTDPSQPLILATTGSTSLGFESGSCSYSFSPSAPISTYSLFPDITLSANAGGLQGSAGFAESTFENFDCGGGSFTFGGAGLQGSFQGTAPFSFALNSTTGGMSLSVGVDTSGSIIQNVMWQGSSGRGCTNIGSGTATPLDFEFNNGIVTVSTNSLGLALPGVGSAANFALSSVSGFQGALPVTIPSGGMASDAVSQSADVFPPAPTPEPGSIGITAAGLLLVLSVRRGKR